MKKDRTCKHCKKVFKNIDGKVFSNHMRWCDKNPNHKKYIEDNKKHFKKLVNEKYGELKKFKVICFKCKKHFEIEERIKQFPKKEKYFCSRKCANGKKWSEEDNIKKSISAKKSEKVKIANKKKRVGKERICKQCNKIFYNKNKTCFCNNKCRKQFNYKIRLSKNIYESYWQYRRDCNFNFNLKDYPNEFDFNLIKKYGWYKPKNRGDNLNGVSRDHIISVKYGFENNISPEIISHPANCQLMVHNENVKKYIDCDITIKELKEKINKWNKKYSYMGNITN